MVMRQPLIPVSSLLQDSSSQVNPAGHAERQVEAALDDLIDMGALQQTNWMDIESLLNPEGESHILMETSDWEIYEAVMAAIKACENIDINGGDNIKDGSHSHVDPCPTYRDALKAVSDLQWQEQGHEKHGSYNWLFPQIINYIL